MPSIASMELLRKSNHVRAAVTGDGELFFDVELVSAGESRTVRASHGFPVQCDRTVRDAPITDLVLVPAFDGDVLAQMEANGDAVHWVRRAHDRGARVASMCTGTFLLVNSPDEVRRAIAYWTSEGVSWFKFTGQVTREVMRAGIEEAHARGARVTGHLCSVTFREAAELGIDLLQHGFITASDYVPGKQPDVCPPENMRIQADVDVQSPEVPASIRAIVPP